MAVPILGLVFKRFLGLEAEATYALVAPVLSQPQI